MRNGPCNSWARPSRSAPVQGTCYENWAPNDSRSGDVRMTKLKIVALIFLLLIIGQTEEYASARGFGSLNGAPDAQPSTVSFWNGSEAFAKGSLLLDRMAASNYQVYAVRRDKPGVVEQHALDTDIVMVLDGAATFMTGGSVAS